MPDRISFNELEDKLRDIDIDEEDLAAYFTADPAKSKPFAPVLQPDPDKVGSLGSRRVPHRRRVCHGLGERHRPLATSTALSTAHQQGR